MKPSAGIFIRDFVIIEQWEIVNIEAVRLNWWQIGGN